MKIVICGIPKSGKSTLALGLSTLTGYRVFHCDSLKHLPWSEQSEKIIELFTVEGSIIIEGVKTVYSLRKWKDRNPDKGCPIDCYVWLDKAKVPLSREQEALGRGMAVINRNIATWVPKGGLEVGVVYSPHPAPYFPPNTG